LLLLGQLLWHYHVPESVPKAAKLARICTAEWVAFKAHKAETPQSLASSHLVYSFNLCHYFEMQDKM